MRSNFRTFTLLLLHFSVVFVNDVIMIYITMWFSEPKGVKFAKHGEALITGLEYGSISLILYTIIDNLKINNKILSQPRFFSGSLLAIIIFSVFTFYRYSNFKFLLFALLVGIMNQFYRHTVYDTEIQKNPVFERCI